MEKNTKKIIVNSLTISRVLATFSMPFLFNLLSAPVFLLLIGLVLLTDCFDGFLARKWNVSTLFGSFLDMGADKLFAMSILVILSMMFPVMTIPLMLECLIAITNISASKKGGSLKSSQLGRAKTWALGISMFSLLLLGLSPELSSSLKNIKIDNIANRLDTNFSNILSNLKLFLNNSLNNLYSFVSKNEKVIKDISIGLAIVPESIAAIDYSIKSLKLPSKDTKNKIKVSKLLMNKEFIKEILLNEKFYSENKDKTIEEILNIDEVKKLTLDRMNKKY